MKQYKLVEFLSNLNVKLPPAQTLSPPIDDFLATVLAGTAVFVGAANFTP